MFAKSFLFKESARRHQESRAGGKRYHSQGEWAYKQWRFPQAMFLTVHMEAVLLVGTNAIFFPLQNMEPDNLWMKGALIIPPPNPQGDSSVYRCGPKVQREENRPAQGHKGTPPHPGMIPSYCFYCYRKTLFKKSKTPSLVERYFRI